MKLVDTTTKEVWPALWANRQLHEIRAKAISDLEARSTARGVPKNGQVYTMERDGDDDDDDDDAQRSESAVVDQALAAKRHNYQDVRLLTKSRWATFCAEPQDLSKFKARFEIPDVKLLKRHQDAAADIENSLREEAEQPAMAAPAPAEKPEPPKRSPGRPKKAEPVEA